MVRTEPTDHQALQPVRLLAQGRKTDRPTAPSDLRSVQGRTLTWFQVQNMLLHLGMLPGLVDSGPSVRDFSV
jgi:hypothetical protein